MTEPRHPFGHSTSDRSALPDAICGWTGVVGAVAVVLSNVIGSAIVPNYDRVADTISRRKGARPTAARREAAGSNPVG